MNHPARSLWLPVRALPHLGPAATGLLASLCLALAVVAPAAAVPVRDHTITVEDYFTIAHVWQVAISPDASRVVWSEMRWQDDLPSRNIDLWAAETRGGASRRLTFHAAFDGEPVWSRDGQWIYFVSTRKDPSSPALAKGGRQVWRIRWDGTGLQPVTAIDGGIEGWRLGDDGTALFYTVGRDHQDDDGFAKMRTSHKLSYGRGVRRWSTLRRLELQSWRDDKLADVPAYVRSFAVAPDGGRVMCITVPTRRLIDNEGWSEVQILDLGATKDAAKPALVKLPDEVWRAKAPSPYGWLENPTWSDDGKVIAFTIGFDGFPAETIAIELDGTKTLHVSKMPRPEEFSLQGAIAFRPGSRELCSRGTLAALDAVFCVQGVAGGKVGAATRLTPASAGNVADFAFARNGQLAIVAGSITDLPDVWLLGAKGGPRRITRQNPQVDTWKLPQIRTVRWKSKDGREVEGILELPPDYKPGDGKLPLAVELHGGPTSATKLELRYWIYGRTIFAARGWALLSPNYRGSTGYGDAFMTELVGHENERDVQDILSGVDHLIAQGLVDDKRMAVMGWSNGGFLTNCVIAADQRFAAASSGAGVFDQAMQWMIEDTPGHVINYMQGLPWKAREEMHRSSPLYAAEKIRTPTIIHFGENDERVPVQHGRGLFRTLEQYLHVPTQLVVYPGEGHGLQTKAHREAKLRWDIAWFERYVPGFKAAATGKGADDKAKAP